MEELSTQAKGEIAKLKAELRAAEKGWIVSRTAEGSRYDLVLDDGKKLYRVQVKYGNGKSTNSQGAICLSLRKFVGDDLRRSPEYRKLPRRAYTKEEIDAVVVYIPRIDKICWFGPDVFDNKADLMIRYEPSKNGQKKKIIFAADYFW